MITASKQQSIERWDSLPENLKTAMFSETNIDLVWQLGESNKLTEDQIKNLATTVGDVIMGFLNMDDFERELKSDIGADAAVVSAIAKEITQKIFMPIQNDLKKNYSPISLTPNFRPASHPLPEPLPHEGVFSPLKYQELRAQKPAVPKTEEAPVSVPLEEEVQAEEKPFLLHEEGARTETREGEESMKEMPKLNLPPIAAEVGTRPKPAPARIEIGPIKASVNSSVHPPKEPKFVHYSRFFTPSPSGNAFFANARMNINPLARIPKLNMFPKPGVQMPPRTYINPHVTDRRPSSSDHKSFISPVAPILPQAPTGKTGNAIKPLIRSERIVPPPIRPASATVDLRRPTTESPAEEKTNGPILDGNKVYL